MKKKVISISDLALMIGRGFASMDKRFDAIYRRLEAIDRRLCALEQRV
jgi:hypothetical protein